MFSLFTAFQHQGCVGTDTDTGVVMSLDGTTASPNDRKGACMSLPSPEGDLRTINAPTFLQNHNGEQGIRFDPGHHMLEDKESE